MSGTGQAEKDDRNPDSRRRPSRLGLLGVWTRIVEVVEARGLIGLHGFRLCGALSYSQL